MGMTFVLVVHIFISLALIALVLVQRGKGADMGAAFGAGASNTVFGSKGSGNFMTRLTAGLATAFFVTSLILAFLALNQTRQATEVSGSVLAGNEELIKQAQENANVPTLQTDETSEESTVPELSTGTETTTQ
jgi:preprotein translocase subunit SecG